MIIVSRNVAVSGAAHPGFRLHHPQFYIGDAPAVVKAYHDAIALYEKVNKAGEPNAIFEDFYQKHRNVVHAAYKPDPNCLGNVCCVDVAYFTLPAWIFEMHESASLCDLYTAFCQCELLTRKARHSRVFNPRREAGNLQHQLHPKGNYGQS